MMLTGMRPGEICRMAPAEIHRGGKVDIPVGKKRVRVDLDKLGNWLYLPKQHKTAYKGKARPVLLGPRVREILTPFLLRAPTAACFSPQEAIADLRKQQTAERLARGGGSGGNKKPPAENRKRFFRDAYDPGTLAQAVEKAIGHANRRREADGLPEIEHWTPYQIRHLFACEIPDLNVARAAMGHSDAQVTLVYAQRDLDAASRYASARG